MRPWMVMRAFGIPFEEIVIPLRTPESKAMVLEHSPSGRVPALVTHELAIWESMAIIEFLAETFPDKAIWPENRVARAHARAIANEMHGGFIPLRSGCPMDMGSVFETPEMSDALQRDIARIEAIWKHARETYGGKGNGTHSGPYLFGAFSAADAMFAPVVSRFISFQIPVTAASQRYIDAITAHPAYAEWRDQALDESWIIPEYASGHSIVESLMANSENTHG